MAWQAFSISKRSYLFFIGENKLTGPMYEAADGGDQLCTFLSDLRICRYAGRQKCRSASV
jgi:hypothetical protein